MRAGTLSRRRLLLAALLAIATTLAGALTFLALGFSDGAIAQQPTHGAKQPAASPVPSGQLRPESGADMWRGIRQGIRGRVSIPDEKAAQLVQSEGDNWRDIRNGPLVRYGGYALGGIVALLALFFVVRGRIRVEKGFAGRTITRFGFVERFAHWLVAVSFVILGLTGLNITFGRLVLLPVIGKPAFAMLSLWGKYLHNYVAFAFTAGLLLVFLLWVADNIPNRHDIKWLARGGGLFAKGSHPPARKFNAGQKILFWLVILGGLSLVLSGLDLLFPFEMAMFSKTFALINLVGTHLPTDIAPIHEMQLAAIWHAAMALFMIVVILGHIYIGTLGMEGAFDAMGTGEVDVNWAREHHPIWVDELEAKPSPAPGSMAPAE